MGSIRLILHSFRLFWKQPVLLLPLLVYWCFFASAFLYFKYVFAWNQHDGTVNLEVCFLFVASLSIGITGACLWLLEMLKEGEQGRPLNCLTAFCKALFKDLPAALPIAVVWGVVWFMLSVVEMIVTQHRKEKESEIDGEGAARSLAGYDDVSLSHGFFQALQKGIRMIVFLILPGIALEGLGSGRATRKGLTVLRLHWKEFAFGYALTYAAATLVFIPAGILIMLGSKGAHGRPPLINFPPEAWVGLNVYIGVATSFCLYLEQMFGASLYLWHLKWEQASADAVASGQKPPLFKEVPPPYLLKTFEELQDFLPIFEAHDDLGRTPLHIAAGNGEIDKVEVLISKGADRNVQDKAGETPLDYAARGRHLHVVHLLVSAGARDTTFRLATPPPLPRLAESA